MHIYKTSTEIIEEYEGLSWSNRGLIKELAIQSLLEKGNSGDLASEVNNSIVLLYKRYGNFDTAIEEGW